MLKYSPHMLSILIIFFFFLFDNDDKIEITEDTYTQRVAGPFAVSSKAGTVWLASWVLACKKNTAQIPKQITDN